MEEAEAPRRARRAIGVDAASTSSDCTRLKKKFPKRSDLFPNLDALEPEEEEELAAQMTWPSSLVEAAKAGVDLPAALASIAEAGVDLPTPVELPPVLAGEGDPQEAQERADLTRALVDAMVEMRTEMDGEEEVTPATLQGEWE